MTITDWEARAEECWTGPMDMAKPKSCAFGSFEHFKTGYLAGVRAGLEAAAKVAELDLENYEECIAILNRRLEHSSVQWHEFYDKRTAAVRILEQLRALMPGERG